MSDPLVSILMPTYQRDQYLRYALDTLSRQNYKNFELLIGDNANSADTAAVVASYNDPRFHYVARPENLGMLANMLGLARESRGKYFAIHADDDAWHEDFLAKLVPALETYTDANIAFTDHFFIDEHNRLRDAPQSGENRWMRSLPPAGYQADGTRIALVDRAIPEAVAALFRRSVIDLNNFPEGVGTCFDLWLSYLATVEAGAVYYIAEPLTYYRIHQTSTTSAHQAKINVNARFCYHKFLADPRLRQHYPHFRHEIRMGAAILGVQLLFEGRNVEARSHLMESMRFEPRMRNITAFFLSFMPAKVTIWSAWKLRNALGWYRNVRKVNRERAMKSAQEAKQL